MDYVVKTEVFEGPFDLLLHLIASQRVDIWQVSLSHHRGLPGRGPPDAGAQPGGGDRVPGRRGHPPELKARLLPAPDTDPDEIEAVLEERDLLFARVLQYRAYKQASALFGARLAEQTAYVPRRAAPKTSSARSSPSCWSGSPRRSWPAWPPPPSPRLRPPGQHDPHRTAPAVGRRGGRRPCSPPPGPGLAPLRGPGRPQRHPHRGRDRPACRPGAVQAIVGRARPDVDLR